MHKRIFITGATGFLGAHITACLVANGCKIMALKRSSSATWRNKEIDHRITWIDLDDEAWKNKAIAYQPEIIIHAAWEGVAAADRNNLKAQLPNLGLLADLLDVAKKCRPEKFISLGSQAEYGILDVTVSETAATNPVSAYGIVKNLGRILTAMSCENENINWYWFRVFAVFGEKEGDQWLIPSLIKKLLANEASIPLSEGNQQYAYMYADDLAGALCQFIGSNAARGIYNLSGEGAVSIKELVKMLAAFTNDESNTLLDFGALPLRKDQSLHVEGNMEKFYLNAGRFKTTDFESALKATIQYYKENEKIK